MIVQLKLNNKPEIGDVLIIDPFTNFTLTCTENKIDYKFSVEGKFKDKYIEPGTILHKVATAILGNSSTTFTKSLDSFKILK